MRKHAVPLLGVAVALAVMLSVWGCAASPEVVRTTTATAKPAAPPPKPGPVPVSLTPTRQLRPSPDLLALGKRVYEKQCVACHGLDGSGEGEAAYLLYPKPRDFVAPLAESRQDAVRTERHVAKRLGVRHHAQHHVGALDRGAGRVGDNHAPGRQRKSFRARSVVAGDGMAGGQEALDHGAAHGAQ